MASRRSFIKRSGVALSYILGGAHISMTPANAREQDVPLRVFSDSEASTLEALAEAIVPGARQAGICHYLDHHLAQDPEECLLMIKYLGLPPQAYTSFYQSGLANCSKLAKARFHREWSALKAEEATTLLGDMTKDKTPLWQGAPASFYFFVLRSDATDLVYGTVEGFEGIDFPYMPHITPEASW